MSNRTWQQRFVFERLQDNLNSVTAYNEKLDMRATLITGASSAIVGIVAAARFLPDAVDGRLNVESLLLGVVCLFSVGMFWFGTVVWQSNVKAIPGSTDVDTIYDQYIAQTEETAFNNALIDVADAVQRSIEVNSEKWSAVRSMLRLFQCQIVTLALAIGWNGLVAIINTFIQN